MNRIALMLACVAGFLAAGCSGSARHGSHEAVAWLRVRGEASRGDPGGSDAHRKTQDRLIKSPLVLNTALRQPGIAGLRPLSGQPDPVGWLARRDMLEKKYKENMAEVREKLETFNDLARTLGTRDSAEVATHRSLILDHLGELRKELVHQRRDIVTIDADLAAIEATKDVTALGNANADLEARRNEIAHLQAVINQTGVQLNAAEADIGMPSRVEFIEEAAPGEATNGDAS